MQDPYTGRGSFKLPKNQRAHKGPLRRNRKRTLRLGSLCTGFGGLDMAVQRIFGAELAWVADTDPHISKLLARRFLGVPNLGDITRVDWRRLELVDIVCTGFPCQDISYAGRGAGIAHCVRDA